MKLGLVGDYRNHRIGLSGLTSPAIRRRCGGIDTDFVPCKQGAIRGCLNVTYKDRVVIGKADNRPGDPLLGELTEAGGCGVVEGELDCVVGIGREEDVTDVLFGDERVRVDAVGVAEVCNRDFFLLGPGGK